MWKGECPVGVSTDALVADQAPVLEGVVEKSELGQLGGKGDFLWWPDVGKTENPERGLETEGPGAFCS